MNKDFRTLADEAINSLNHDIQSVAEAFGLTEERTDELVDKLNEKAKEAGGFDKKTQELAAILSVSESIIEVYYLLGLVTSIRERKKAEQVVKMIALGKMMDE